MRKVLFIENAALPAQKHANCKKTIGKSIGVILDDDVDVGSLAGIYRILKFLILFRHLFLFFFY